MLKLEISRLQKTVEKTLIDITIIKVVPYLIV
jgi:hypothetical protein